jgi:hypothetical protein
MAKTKRKVASLAPDEMFVGGGGLPDKFTGVIESVRNMPWRYPNKPDMDPIFAYRIRIRPDEDQEDEAVLPEAELEKHDGLVEQHYSSGKLEQFVPSMYGDEPVDSLEVDDEDSEGVFAIPTEAFVEQCEKKGVDPQLNNGTNWADWLQRLLDAKFPIKLLKESDGDARVFEGLCDG